MPTAILRPTSTLSQTAWRVTPIDTILGDHDNSPTAEQRADTCNASLKLSDLDASLSDATINSMTITLRAQAGRTGANTCVMAYLESESVSFGAETESFTSTVSEETTSTRTTQRNGSSPLTFAYINAMGVIITPGVSGITVAQLFVTVDYTAAIVPPLKITEGLIKLTNGLIKIT